MAENIFVCKHLKGAGYCTLYEDYCHEGPCGDSTPVEYSPVVHGQWVHTDMAAWWFGKDECSECQYHDDERNDLSRLKYCPNCGAKMDGDGDWGELT